MTDKTEMPLYQCYKKVHALKIKEINNFDGAIVIQPEDHGWASFTVDEYWYEKHEPEAGGYYVVYEDGYKSYSPAKAFEDGYTLIK